MKTILDSYESLLEIERSSFYSFLFPIEDENHAKRIIEEEGIEVGKTAMLIKLVLFKSHLMMVSQKDRPEDH